MEENLLDSALNQLYKYYENRNKSQTKQLDIQKVTHQDFKTLAEQFHDAAYDAYCTGYIYLSQMIDLDSVYQNKLKQTDQNDFNGHLESLKNKLFMMQSLYHINLDPETPEAFLKYEVYSLYVYHSWRIIIYTSDYYLLID